MIFHNFIKREIWRLTTWAWKQTDVNESQLRWKSIKLILTGILLVIFTTSIELGVVDLVIGASLVITGIGY